MRNHVILFLAANPRVHNPLQLAEECADIQRELTMSPHRDDFQFESRWAVSIDELMRHLNELSPTVIHFAGHGAGKPAGSERGSGRQRDIVVPGARVEGGIYLQDEQGQPQLVSPRALAMMIKAAGGSARVVVLNACYTAAQADVLRDKIECIVGMDGAIEDEAARAFAIRFYGALGNRRSVGNAVDQAVAALAAKQMPDELLPRCMTRDGVDAHRVFLEPS